jgi:2-oxoglutarate ferredoxin oxidoreductase subunit alpha
MSEVKNVVELEDAVIKFVGDSGDGMQLSGTLFADTAAYDGNDLTTFPDYPAEIRAPQNTVAGVSGFQIHFGSKKILTFGDICDTIVALNPASLRANLKWTKKDTIIITDSEAYDDSALEKSGYKSNPLTDGSLKEFKIISAPFTTLIKEAISDLNIDNKTTLKSRNMFALGIAFKLYGKNLDHTFHYLEKKFATRPQIVEMNKRVVKAGFDYAAINPQLECLYNVPSASMEKGRYRNITGNVAAAWGLIAAGEKSERPLFLGSYPITPATEILMEIVKYKSLGAKVFQAEDEIAGICSAIGASFTGSLALTTTSGPGLSLKSEAIGLAVITELPLVIVNVQRGGPSTGLPTKSEQSDLYQALYGRNGECPLIVMAASSSADCFYSAFEAAKLSIEHMTPVILLTDGSLGNGSELFRIPDTKDLPKIVAPLAKANDPNYKPYNRDEKTLARPWAIPGTEGLRHRVGGLEKENGIGTVSMDPINHELMVGLRAEKVQRVANYIDPQEVFGDTEGDLLIVSWGGTKGVIRDSVIEMKKEGYKVGHAHFKHIMPLPKNTEEIFGKYKKIIVCELNSGQFVGYLRITFPDFKYHQANKVQSLPFMIHELKDKYYKLLEK